MTILAKNRFLPAKTYFCQSGFYRGKNQFFPPSGKNLPTLTKIYLLMVTVNEM